MNLPSASTLEVPKSMFDFFSIHKWTLTMFGGTILTIPALDQLPEGVGIMGVLTFLFGLWRQWREDVRKQELHNEKIKLVKKISENERTVSDEVIGQILDNK